MAESHLLSYDSTLTPEHRVMIDQVVRYPTLTARGALPAYSRPAVYALSIKTLEDPALADLTGAFALLPSVMALAPMMKRARTQSRPKPPPCK